MNVTPATASVAAAPDDRAATHKFVVILEARHDGQEAGPAQRLFDQLGMVRMVRNEVLHAVRREHVPAAAERIGVVDEIWCRGRLPEPVLDVLRNVYVGRAVLQISLVQEHTIFARQTDDAALVKRISLLRRKSGLSRAEFGAYWLDVHAPMASCHRHVARYVQNHVIADATADAPFDGLGEFRITDLIGMQADYDTAAGKAMRADVQNFAAMVNTYVVREKCFEAAMQVSPS